MERRRYHAVDYFQQNRKATWVRAYVSHRSLFGSNKAIELTMLRRLGSRKVIHTTFKPYEGTVFS